jgi:hypothetical protein
MGVELNSVRYVINSEKFTMYRCIFGSNTVLMAIDVNGFTYAQIKANIDTFLRIAVRYPGNTYRITSTLGDPYDIAPMFATAPLNCVLPLAWKSVLYFSEGRRFWQG